MTDTGKKPLIEDLFKLKKSKERAVKIWFLKVEGHSNAEIAKILKTSKTNVFNYLRKIKETGAVLTNEGLDEMKRIYLDRKELLIKKVFEDLEKAETINERVKLIRLLSHLIDTQADAFWRTLKEEKVSEESPLSIVRQWVSTGKLPGDES